MTLQYEYEQTLTSALYALKKAAIAVKTWSPAPEEPLSDIEAAIVEIERLLK